MNLSDIVTVEVFLFSHSKIVSIYLEINQGEFKLILCNLSFSVPFLIKFLANFLQVICVVKLICLLQNSELTDDNSMIHRSKGKNSQS